jgi:serine/threonine-protein kinase
VLRATLERREWFPTEAITQIALEIGDALDAMHALGLLHRDVKPANIELCRAADEVDIVKVLDFGIVHNIADPIGPVRITTTYAPTDSGERLTTEGAVIGTPGYIPPEQALAASIDPRGDLYALGCVAWFLLTGAEVFPGTDGDEVMHQHVTQPVPTLRDKVAGWLPQELEDLIQSCLAKHPRSRPPDARALADALYAIAIPPEHAWSRPRAHAWWASLKPSGVAQPDAPTAVPVSPPTTAGNTVADAARVLVPHRAPAPSADLPTVMSRPSRSDVAD